MRRYAEDAFLKKIHFLMSGDKSATRMFVQACVLAGCDFLDSLPNMGIVVRSMNRIKCNWSQKPI